MRFSIYLALKQLFPTGRNFSVFALVAIIGVTLGVSILIVVQSIMNGFTAEIREKLNQASGDIRIQARGLILRSEEVVAQLDALPEVGVIETFAEGVVMIQHRNIPEFPGVRGIDVMLDEHTLPIESYLIEGSLDDLDDGRVLVGSTLARNLDILVGDSLEVFTPLMLDRLKKDEILLPEVFEVAGIVETGYQVIDKSTIFVTLRTMQDLYGLGSAVHGISLNVAKGIDTESFAHRLNTEILPDGLTAYTWMDRHSEYLFVLAFEKTAMFVLNLFIVLVAAFSISIALYTSILRKTREIGLLGAMGVQPRAIAGVFATQGFIVGLTGTALGFGVAVSLLHFREPFLRFVLNVFEKEAVFVRFYQFLRFPVEYKAFDFASTFAMTLLLTTLAALVPALLAANQRPAEALRYE